MKYFNLLIFCLFFMGCSKTESVYWCGDHACRSTAEKDAYFKKNMTVEIRELNRSDKVHKSDLEIIKEQAGLDEKNSKLRSKSFRNNSKINKKRIQNEKKLAKQSRINELKRIQNEKKLAKQSRINELKRIQNEKRLLKKSHTSKRKNKVQTKTKSYKNKKKYRSNKYASLKKRKIENVNVDFKELVNKIINRNAPKPYPDVNDIPN